MACLQPPAPARGQRGCKRGLAANAYRFLGGTPSIPALYVADGSVVPANLAVNPSLTITALSEYIMSQVPSKAS